MPRKEKKEAPVKEVRQTDVRPGIIWQSHAGPQSYLFETDAEFILYGGAAGGGKSDSLLILLGGIDTDKDGYKAIFFRRTFPELEKYIIPQSRRYFNGVGEYQSKLHRWKFRTPSRIMTSSLEMTGEAFLDFGFMEKEDDVSKYDGSDYARIGFDESTQFSENQVRRMTARNRSQAEGVLRQTILASNPVGPGYGWHKLLFHDGREPFDVYEDAVWPSDKRPVQARTCFIPARIWDNPTLLKADPKYIQRLQGQSIQVAKALLEGSWAETIFLAIDFNEYIHTIKPFPLPGYCVRVIGIDWGKGDKAVAVWLAADDKFIYPYRDYATKGKDIVPFAYEVANRTKIPGTSEMEKIDYIVLSHECFNDIGMTETQSDQFRKVFDQFGWSLLKSDKDPVGRLALIREYLRTSSIPVVGGLDVTDYDYWTKRAHSDPNWFTELARLRTGTYDVTELPKMKLFKTPENGDPRFGCPELIQTLPLLVTDQTDTKELMDGQDDHAFDALGYGLKGLISYGGLASVPPEAHYARIMGGRMPETGMQAELAMEAAKQMAQDSSTDEPVEWHTEKFRKDDIDI